jgi:hypothetical protein
VEGITTVEEMKLATLTNQCEAFNADVIDLERTAQLTDHAAAVLFSWLRAMRETCRRGMVIE